ncbi:tetratricopeptide repeat protein [Lentisphaera marina]|uniref:tetratricopeptide repeat protein n=1 Tax=Lentisphaera marina TaxID=1111041 RepID=UPI0023656C1A|nr:tetratricopeptide repeat protein [Lentisphaera marina]MDD7986099.1 tetratricopeptide repeat protein [Lentisphaera marina]
MKYLLYFLSFTLLALEPTVPREQKNQYQEVIALISKDPDKALVELGDMDAQRSAIFDYLEGSIYLDKKDQSKALIQFSQAVKKLPEFTRAHKALAFLYLEQNKHEQALKHLSLVISLGSGDASTWKNLAYVHMSLKNWQAAWFAFENVRLFEPKNPQLKKYFLDIRMHQENYQEAQLLAKEIIEEKPQDRNTWLTYISCLNQLDKQEEALANFILFEQLFELNDSEKSNLAGLYYSQENYLAAAKYFGQVSGELEVGAKLKQAYALMNIQKFAEAANILAKLRDIEFNNKESYFQVYAQVQMNLGKNKEALKLYQEALKYNANSGLTLMAIAQVADQEADYELAIDFYTRSLKHKDLMINALLRRARIYLIQEKWSLAEQDAKAVINSQANKNSKAFAQNILDSIQR